MQKKRLRTGVQGKALEDFSNPLGTFLVHVSLLQHSCIKETLPNACESVSISERHSLPARVRQETWPRGMAHKETAGLTRRLPHHWQAARHGPPLQRRCCAADAWPHMQRKEDARSTIARDAPAPSALAVDQEHPASSAMAALDDQDTVPCHHGTTHCTPHAYMGERVGAAFICSTRNALAFGRTQRLEQRCWIDHDLDRQYPGLVRFAIEAHALH